MGVEDHDACGPTRFALLRMWLTSPSMSAGLPAISRGLAPGWSPSPMDTRESCRGPARRAAGKTGVFHSLPVMSHRAMSMPGDGVHHERSAAHVAMGPKELLPQILDARRIFIVEQREQRPGQMSGDLRLELVDFAPAGDAVVGFRSSNKPWAPQAWR